MKVYMVFQDWKKDGKSIYQTEQGVELSKGDLHSGTTFPAEIVFTNVRDYDAFLDLHKAMAAGYTPTFDLVKR